MILALAYLAIFLGAGLVLRLIRRHRIDAARRTVSFGDAGAVRPDRVASVLSVATIFLIWGAFTGSKLVPVHVPGPFTGETAFSYTVTAPDGASDTATVRVTVLAPADTPPQKPLPPAPRSGLAQDDTASVAAWRYALVRPTANDAPGVSLTAIDGQPVTVGQPLRVAHGQVTLTPKGSLSFAPDKGWQMEPIWLPAPESVAARFWQIAREGYQNKPLWEHLGFSLFRVLAGFFFGALIGIPLGYAMGLSGWVRGWFDPIVEFMRPVPPLALIPLIIIWWGIWETGKIVLLFLAALWIMVIAARSGVAGVRLSKVHAAYSLGASKWQVLTQVIIPNSLPDLFIGARVAMGVCWGTVVAAELVAAEKGAGMMILVASKFQLTDIVVMGILLIGLIGYGIDVALRAAERRFVPWRGRTGG
ncbi:ABC transporter permease subunit [Rhodobacter capsulatus]|uniref:ABC transporter permease subunit n=1 Tax=Rhodobacter capsulatus TaxID=1061 RepID=UPI0003D2CD34|nr:ABC transporter permease subunit [Rhodobacter capsulatus]ETD89141.1 taurine ABC transporter permease [Rhodobacter capsulatus YW2]